MPIIINKAFLIWEENVIGRMEMLIGFQSIKIVTCTTERLENIKRS